jgi:hypothetical protein
MPEIDEVMDYKVIPALPGFALWFIHEGELLGQAPIVGWICCRRPCYDGQRFTWTTEPVMPDAAAPTQEYAIQFPDGRVCIPDVETFENIDAARASLKAKHEGETSASRAREAWRDACVKPREAWGRDTPPIC